MLCIGVWFYFFLFSFCLLQFPKEDKQQPEESDRPGVIISNHVSYLDILYHMSSSFPSFVAKVCVMTNFLLHD